jgi:hypothetical protein
VRVYVGVRGCACVWWDGWGCWDVHVCLCERVRVHVCACACVHVRVCMRACGEGWGVDVHILEGPLHVASLPRPLLSLVRILRALGAKAMVGVTRSRGSRVHLRVILFGMPSTSNEESIQAWLTSYPPCVSRSCCQPSAQ